MPNKKVKNASKAEFLGIEFKSSTEKRFYEYLLNEGFNPQYEPITFTLWEGFIPKIPFYTEETKRQKIRRDPDNKTRFSLILNKSKVIGIKYTPDFYFKYKSLNVYIEAKGFENDVFYLKKKLFRKYLDDRFSINGQKSIYLEVYTLNQLKQAIEIIKSYEQQPIATNK